MIRWLLNVALLSGKELRSLLRDVALMVLVAFFFTVGVYSVAKGVKAEVSNASVAILDGDHSDLSRRLRHAIRPPYFTTPVDIARPDIATALDRGKYIFIIEIPPRFETDVLAGRSPTVQMIVDATAMTQAGLGTADLQRDLQQRGPGLARHQGHRVEHAGPRRLAPAVQPECREPLVVRRVMCRS